MVMRKGADAELESIIEEPNVNLVLNDQALPQPASGPRGVGEVVVVILLDKVGTDGHLERDRSAASARARWSSARA